MTVPAFDSVLSTTITGPLDVFQFAGGSANLIDEESPVAGPFQPFSQNSSGPVVS